MPTEIPDPCPACGALQADWVNNPFAATDADKKFGDMTMADELKGNKDALVAAVISWWADTEGQPESPADARLMQALWRYEGDHTQPCPDCDGDCGEPCAPVSGEVAIAGLDRWIADWMKRRGITQGRPVNSQPQT